MLTTVLCIIVVKKRDKSDYSSESPVSDFSDDQEHESDYKKGADE